MGNLIEIDEARSAVLEAAGGPRPEPVPLDHAAGRILAEQLVSGGDVPPFDVSAMDGFAVCAGPGGELRVAGESRAGHPAEAAVAPGLAVRISTGAALPRGAGAVVPVERAEEVGGSVAVPETRPGENIRRAGEDVRAGQVVLRPGRRLGAAELGVAAALGRPELLCGVRPRVELVVTGDELVEPGAALGPGRIWSSNGYALAAQAAAAGAEIAGRETVPDDPEATRASLARALGRADVVCVSGGVSVGPHDHVKPALAALGVEERFWGVRLKPGKPAWFGVAPGGERPVLVFGLPGNPVSAMVTFQLLVRPALLFLQGGDPAEARTTALLAEPVARSPQRLQAVRCRLTEGEEGRRAEPTGPQGSHVLTSMLGADALALIPPGEGSAEAGERVEVELLRSGMFGS